MLQSNNLYLKIAQVTVSQPTVPANLENVYIRKICHSILYT